MSSSLFEEILKKIDQKNTTQRIFKILMGFLIVVILGIVSNILFPTVMSIIFNIIWIVLLAIVIVFIFLGILVIVGLREEAGQILDVLLEGSLTLVDLIRFLKELYQRFVTVLKEFLIYAAPVFSYGLNLIIYIALMFLYKYIGKNNDVTALTFILTIVLITVVSFLTKPSDEVGSNAELAGSQWFTIFKKRIHESFADGMEILLFLFFLTMDSTNLFFLPESLNVPLKAELSGYDLMIRGFVYNNHLKITTILIIIATFTEIVRNALRIVVSARSHYQREVDLEHPNLRFAERLKIAIRKSFQDAKDDFVKFITYTTFLLFVFILFPRLKLLTLAIASVTSLILDILMPSRVKPSPRNDLISKVLTKVLRL